MLWAIGSSIFVIYLYRKLNIANVAVVQDASTASVASVENELATLNSQISALENKIAAPGQGALQK